MRRMTVSLVGLAVVAGLLAGCGGGKGPATARSSPATPAATATSPATTSPSAIQQTTGSAVPTGFSLAEKRGGTAPSPASLLRVIRVGRHAGYDRVVFEFVGAAPAYGVRYVDEVREDPSDRPVDLDGHAFLLVVMHGGTLDTAPQVTDPSQARSYTGPRRIHPDLAVVEDVAAAGDFEAVLSFGLGVDRRVPFQVLRLTAPGRIVVDVATG